MLRLRYIMYHVATTGGHGGIGLVLCCSVQNMCSAPCSCHRNQPRHVPLRLQVCKCEGMRSIEVAYHFAEQGAQGCVATPRVLVLQFEPYAGSWLWFNVDRNTGDSSATRIDLKYCIHLAWQEGKRRSSAPRHACLPSCLNATLACICCH